MAEYRPKNLEPLLELFNAGKKAHVERHCRSLVVHYSDLAALFVAGRVGVLSPYKYACHFDDRVPSHLLPKQSEPDALAKASVGPLNAEGRKLVRRIFQTFEERRLFAAHLFYTPEWRYWHVFYFDQRDREGRRNHWRHGSHIHYANDTFHREPLQQIWARVQPVIPHSSRAFTFDMRTDIQMAMHNISVKPFASLIGTAQKRAALTSVR